MRVVTSGIGEDSFWITTFGWNHTGNYFGNIVIVLSSLEAKGYKQGATSGLDSLSSYTGSVAYQGLTLPAACKAGILG